MGERRFVVQLHRARRVHYDFRVEIDGVLVSWAVPKGPSLDPKVRRGAFHVEDHPMEYVAFEGVIPAGTYGGGDVIVWDTGSWVPYKNDDPRAAVDKGELHMELYGEKLRGKFVIVRTRGDDWLLMHKRDEYAVDGWDAGSLPLSVLSGRSSDQVRDDPEYLWRSDLPAARAAVAVKAGAGSEPPGAQTAAPRKKAAKAVPRKTATRAAPHGAEAEGPTRKGTDAPRTAAAGPATRKPGTGDAPGTAAAGAATRKAGTGDATRTAAARAATRKAGTGGGGGRPLVRVDADAVAELEKFADAGTWHVFGREVRITNLNKVLFAGRRGEAAVTKREILRYAMEIAPIVLPYLSGRALNLHRFPNGSGTKGFWQKALPSHAPEWLERWREPESGTEYLVASEAAALVWAVNFGGLEWHPWTSRVERPDRPTYALVDLDPGDDTRWEDLLVLARLHRTAFEHLGVAARAKVTGQRGIQIWVPIAAGPSFAQTRAWVEGLSRSVGAVVPDLVSWAWEKAGRGGLARLDFTQNAINKTLVAPYSPRPAPGAPVSAPIDWDELDDPRLRPDGFTIRTIGARLAERGDLFADVLDRPQTLPPLR